MFMLELKILKFGISFHFLFFFQLKSPLYLAFLQEYAEHPYHSYEYRFSCCLSPRLFGQFSLNGFGILPRFADAH